MQHRLFVASLVASVLAIASGCGEVGAPPDAGDELGALREGCAVMLRMNEASWSGASSVIDACGGDHNGTPSGGISTEMNAVRGRTGFFDGTGCITIPDAPELRPTTQLTMSAWVLPTDLSGNLAYGVISKRLDIQTESAYNLFLRAVEHAFAGIEGNEIHTETRTRIATNTWTQLTVTYDGSRAQEQRVRVFVNGALDVAGAEMATTIAPYTSPLQIGCLPSPSNQTMQYFKGSLDEVAIWTRALSDPEVGQWFTATKP